MSPITMLVCLMFMMSGHATTIDEQPPRADLEQFCAALAKTVADRASGGAVGAPVMADIAIAAADGTQPAANLTITIKAGPRNVKALDLLLLQANQVVRATFDTAAGHERFTIAYPSQYRVSQTFTIAGNVQTQQSDGVELVFVLRPAAQK